MLTESIDLLRRHSMEPEELEKSVAYLSGQLKPLLYPRERVLLCFHDHQYGNISYLMEQAVLRCGGTPVLWNEDIRWINLLRLAFSTRAGCIIGPPLVILGLGKVAKARRTPLFLRNAVLAGYPAPQWMVEGIESILDCRAWGCFNLGLEGIVCGFSCQYRFGVHLREEEFSAEIVDEQGGPLPPGQPGRILLRVGKKPACDVLLPDNGVLNTRPCMCGRTSPTLQQMNAGLLYDQDLLTLGQQLQSWNSVLDCRLEKGPGGLELEMIYFPGERLPKLPTVAKLVSRPWEPEKDEPFWYFPLSGPEIFSEKS